MQKPKDLASIQRLLASVAAYKKQNNYGPDGSLLDFARWFFPVREGMNFITGPHHEVMGRTLDRVYRGEIKRLIITVPPGYTKTEMAVVAFIAKGFQINPKARFIHATFSDDLARENSGKVKTLLDSPEYAELAKVELKQDSRAIDRWKTEQGGGLLAKAAGGPITGFRAGYMDRSKFTGALVIDDPLKPDDAFSVTMRANVNRRATNTFRSRLAHDDVPIIVIMQRLHDDDFAGHLLKGGTGDKWHHLELSVMIDNHRDYPKQWTHGIPIDHGLPDGPLWRDKHSEAEIEVLKVDSYTYKSQYDQRPQTSEGALFDYSKFLWWLELPPMEYTRIYADTAQKTAERNDYSVFQLWGKARTGGIYLIDQVRGKFTAPQLEATARAFWKKCHASGYRPRGMLIEDKSSGTGLIQSLGMPQQGKDVIPVEGISRDIDKYRRGLDAAPWVAAGMVNLPAEYEHKADLELELQTFDGLGTGHDDQVDPLMDAISDMLNSGGLSWSNAL